MDTDLLPLRTCRVFEEEEEGPEWEGPEWEGAEWGSADFREGDTADCRPFSGFSCNENKNLSLNPPRSSRMQ